MLKGPSQVNPQQTLVIIQRPWNHGKQQKLKLNSSRAKRPMKKGLISNFYGIKRMSLWLPLDGTLTHRRLAPSRSWYSFTHPGRMESWVSLGGKEDRTKIQISAEPGIELGTLRSIGRVLTNCTNHNRPENRVSFGLTEQVGDRTRDLVVRRQRSYQLRQP